MKLDKKQWLIVGIVLSMMMWGISWPSAKVLSRYGQPIEIAFIRFLFTFIGVFILLKGIRTPLAITKKGLSSLTVASMLMAFYSMLFFSGIKKGMPGAGGVLVTTTSPIVAFLLGALLARRKLVSKEIIGLIIGLIAGTFLLRLWSNYDHVFESGNLFFLASTVVWAVLSRFTSNSYKYGSALAFSLWMYLLCIVWLSFFVDFHHILQILQHGDSLFWFNMLFNAVLNTGIATTIFFYGTSILGAEKTSSFIYIVPFAASISAFLFLGEIIHWNTLVGGLLGLSAVWVINKKAQQKNPEKEIG